MKKATIALALLLGAPLAAQSFEVGLFVGQQQYPSPHTEVSPGLTGQLNLDNKTVYAARFGYSVVDLGPALFQITAGYQPESKTTVKATLGGAPSGIPEDLKQSHWSVGAMFNFKAVVAVGAGLEYRAEKLELQGESTTYNRPWARLNLGYAIPSPVVKPFIGVEVAFPLTTTSNKFDSIDNVLKSMAPKNQFGIYAGIRF
jgi:hypothetical protein